MRISRLGFACALGALLTAGTARAIVVTTPRRIMVIGDSIMAGTGLQRVQNQATYRLQRATHAEFQNFASPGATMADVGTVPGMNQASASVNLLAGIAGHRLYGLVVVLGTNDWALPAITPDGFEAAYGAFLEALPTDLHVVCMSSPWSSFRDGRPNTYGETLDDYRARTKAVCEAHGYTYLDGTLAVPHDPSFYVDGLHPNDRGHRAMATFLLGELRRLGWL